MHSGEDCPSCIFLPTSLKKSESMVKHQLLRFLPVNASFVQQVHIIKQFLVCDEETREIFIARCLDVTSFSGRQVDCNNWYYIFLKNGTHPRYRERGGVYYRHYSHPSYLRWWRKWPRQRQWRRWCWRFHHLVILVVVLVPNHQSNKGEDPLTPRGVCQDQVILWGF